MAERTLIDAMARAVFVADHPGHMVVEDWDSGARLGGGDGYRKHCYDVARAALRALHDHGPTQGMLEAASKLESDCARLNYGGTPSAEDMYSAMLAAELDGGANG